MKRFEWKPESCAEQRCAKTARTTADVHRDGLPARAAKSNIHHSTAISRERSATKERHYRGNDNAPLAFARGALA
ncbi:hypothetical protein [Paraburkholderia tropica]|uniref:hypothetical protein n=1 Tax=Paraburkholderia tropica TaxID=92647 RepID=UPI001CC803EB|nr:hypothetical protein [Paraburkholderia tropica]